MPATKIFLIAVFGFIITACSWFGDTEEPDIPEPILYRQAMTAMNEESYELAIEKLQLLESRYPFGRFSEQAQLELIYAYYKNHESEATIAAADRFIRLHPNHENIDYAYYLKGMTSFEKDQSWVARYLPIDQTTRDPGAALDSFDSFKTLITRYPESQYAADSQKRMVYLKNRLAAYEVYVARYYIQREAFVAAVNRGSYVIENMQETPAVPDALAVMIEGYTHLGETKLAEDTRAVLVKNFPDYKYQPVYRGEKTLYDAATFDLFSDSKEVPVAKPVHMNQQETRAERSIFSKLSFGLFDDAEEETTEKEKTEAEAE